MSINTDILERLILHKNVKLSHFQDVIEIGNISFMLDRQSFMHSDITKVLKFLVIYNLTRKLKFLLLFFFLSHPKAPFHTTRLTKFLMIMIVC